MKKSQRDPVYKIDEFEDLTLFANEAFDTQDVDLFEFSSEESSPLTQLKSIILSLDWEINDDILQELADELENLQSMWQGDKVAEVYLQGLSKIGGYIRSKGAYAHPNSIKLLLTFFYDFEKIISSQDITGEKITQLLKSDVRKFRILQYQINQNEVEPSLASDEKIVETALAEMQKTPHEEVDPAKELNAAILSLDWEVTDENLKQFNTKLSQYHPRVADNKAAMVLVQGLQVLGDYIAEERADAHPEAFILLHSFNEALEQVAKADEKDLAQGKMRDLLIDRINRLTNLKMLIAAPSVPAEAQLIDEVVEEISAPVATDLGPDQPTPTMKDELLVSSTFLSENFASETQTDNLPIDTLEAEIDTFFAMDTKPAIETGEVQYPDEILPPDAIQPVDDELADDFIEANLSAKRGLMPALSDTDELSGFNEDSEPLDLPAQSDLAEQLDFLFADIDNETAKPPETLSALGSRDLDRAFADIDAKIEENDVAEALAGVEQPVDEINLGREKFERDQNVVDIQSKLDNFFADIHEEPVEPSIEKIEQSLIVNDDSDVESALADSEEEQGFSEEEAVATLNYTPMEEIEEKLAFFFGSDADDESEALMPASAEPAAAALTEETEELSAPTGVLEESLDLVFEDSFEEPTIAPALSGFAAPEPGDRDERLSAATVGMLDNELEGALDFFFDAAEDDETEPETTSTTVDELTQALEATIDDDQAITAYCGQDEQPAALGPEESKQIQLAALGALLPRIVRTTSRDKAAEATQLLAALHKAGLSPEQLALLQLLDSAINLLIRLPAQDNETTEKLVNYLYEHLREEQCLPGVLPEAVRQYTDWMRHACAIMPRIPTATGQDAEPQFAYTAKELYFELSELRGNINEEFAKLRHELHHKA